MANGDDDNQQAADSQSIDKTPPEEKPVQYAGTNKPVPADAQPQQDTGDQGGGATQDDITKHVYELHRRADQDYEKMRKGYEGMQDEIRNNYKELQQLERSPAPQEEAYPEAPDTERKSVALAHMMIGIPAAIFGGNKYNPGGALHGLSDLVKEFKNAGSKRQIAERIALYREQVSIVHQQNEDRFRQYHELMSDRRATIENKLKAIGDLANLYKDQATADKAMPGNWEEFTEYMGKVEKMNADMEEHVLATMDKLHKAFGDTITDRFYRSDGADKYPDLAEGLFSEKNPRAYGKAVNELRKRMPFWKWWLENRDKLYGTESAAEKKAEGEGKPAPPDVPTDDTKAAIKALDPHLLFGTPQPGSNE